MSIHLHRDLEKLQRRIVHLASEVEQTVDQAIVALMERDADLAQELIAGDTKIDLEENQIEEDALKVLALHQPVAGDLRRVVVILKINSDLERMADLAANIAERAHALTLGPMISVPMAFRQMADITNLMVRGSLDAFVTPNVLLAKRVCRLDDDVDRHNRQIIDQLTEIMKASPDRIEAALNVFSASRHLERVADHATNIAEEVVYMVEGTIIRHHPEALRVTEM